MRFEWDENKNIVNIKKHGINFRQVSLCFTDEFIMTKYDEKHSEHEDRYVSMGLCPDDGIIVFIHTFTNIDKDELVRIISGRKANSLEIKIYQERRAKHERPL